MRHAFDLGRYRSAILAIAAMIVMSGAGALSSYLLIGDGMTIDRAGQDDEDCWLCPDDAVDLFVSGRLSRDAADWSGLEDGLYAGDLATADSTDDAVDAAEITFPIVTVLAVVATAQRLSGSRVAS